MEEKNVASEEGDMPVRSVHSVVKIVNDGIRFFWKKNQATSHQQTFKLIKCSIQQLYLITRLCDFIEIGLPRRPPLESSHKTMPRRRSTFDLSFRPRFNVRSKSLNRPTSRFNGADFSTIRSVYVASNLCLYWFLIISCARSYGTQYIGQHWRPTFLESRS